MFYVFRLVLLVALASFVFSTSGQAQNCFAEKLCPQMRDCAEADYYFRQCGHGKRDADGDGIPCENICGDTIELYQERLRASSGEGVAQSQRTEFACGQKRTCKQMTSCAEAQFHLRSCGLTRLDRDKDGMPCESLCRP